MADTQIDLSTLPCDDFTYFKNAVLRHRKDDDNIAHRLNTTDTHSEAQCRHLFDLFTRSYGQRDAVIRRCLQEQTDLVAGLKAKTAANPKDLDAVNHLRTEQLKVLVPLLAFIVGCLLLVKKSNLNPFFLCVCVLLQRRLIESELTAEEIVRERTHTAFKDKCRVLAELKGH